jgi:3-deoxy-7-phosphoheptulonate synthase
MGDARALVAPGELREALALTADSRETVRRGREAVASILHGQDDRLLVIVGPCSIHDPVAALEYARRLADLAERLGGELAIVMRAYFEKPRTTVGWKGLIGDPRLDGTFRVGEGLVSARRLLLGIVSLGLPVGCEFLDPMTPPYLADAVSWGAIGARTSESQVHRQMASGLAMPIGFKNSTGGDVQGAVDGVAAAARAQMFIGIDDDGRAAVFETRGNPDGHVVLRGSAAGPNCDRAGVDDALERLAGAGLRRGVIVDASHGNSGRDHRVQARVATGIAHRLAQGEEGIVGVMLESFLLPGRQELVGGSPSRLAFGQSVTDACMGWRTTQRVLERLAGSMARRRRRLHEAGAQASIHGDGGQCSAAAISEKAVAPSIDSRMTSA